MKHQISSNWAELFIYIRILNEAHETPYELCLSSIEQVLHDLKKRGWNNISVVFELNGTIILGSRTKRTLTPNQLFSSWIIQSLCDLEPSGWNTNFALFEVNYMITFGIEVKWLTQQISRAQAKSNNYIMISDKAI